MRNKQTNIFIVCFAAFAITLTANSAFAQPTVRQQSELNKFSYVQLQMAMPMRITVWTESESHAEATCKLAFAHAAELVKVFSDYDQSSEAMLLTRNTPGNATPISDHLMTVLTFSRELHHKSKGTFDVTAGPIIQLWRGARKTSVLPKSTELKLAFQKVGFDKIQLDSRTSTATMLVEGIELDFGGVAKGYIGDQVTDVLRKNGITISYYEAGGDIVLGDAPPQTTGWTIDVGKNIDGTTRSLKLANCAISTSGDSQQFVEIAGVRYSHVVNPKTGLGVTTGRTAFAIAPHGMQSDALATTGCVLDKVEFQSLLSQYENTTGWSEQSQLISDERHNVHSQNNLSQNNHSKDCEKTNEH